MFQIINNDLPFGGVGASGYGKYHGYDGYKAMSNNKAVMLKPTMNVWPYNALTPPFTSSKQKLVTALLATPGSQRQLATVLKFLFVILLVLAVWLFQKQLYGAFGVAMGVQEGECPFAKAAKQMGMKNPHAAGHPALPLPICD